MDVSGEWTIMHAICYCICACDGQYEAHANSIIIIIKCERNVVWVASKSLLGPQTVYMYTATKKQKHNIMLPMYMHVFKITVHACSFTSSVSCSNICLRVKQLWSLEQARFPG